MVSVSAIGEGNIFYQWYKDGQSITDGVLPNITGCKLPILNILAFSSEHEGHYKCTVSNKDDEIESHDAHIKGLFLY